MSDNTPQPAAPQQPQFTQQTPAAQPAHGAPIEAPKKKWAAVTALVLGIISALTGIIILGAFTAIPTVIFAIIALVMVKRGTGKGKGMAIISLVLVAVAMATFVLGNNVRAQKRAEREQMAREAIQKCESKEFVGAYYTEKDGKRYCAYGGWLYPVDNDK
ncbi:DUF4190 domain-containing protein [uncultured Rothia sp.]|uniref:DUF4190 domain-containing protein n=1 Tax=uncultured Rothia sp. TaxID=316088 RepID=UPI0026249683|nr:DUF4190 domain-containing protein [uncultured Rothia sp.]